MVLIQEFGYSVPPGEEEEHQEWVRDNEEALRAASPEGSRLIGIFANVYSSEKQAGSTGSSSNSTATPQWTGSRTR